MTDSSWSSTSNSLTKKPIDSFDSLGVVDLDECYTSTTKEPEISSVKDWRNYVIDILPIFFFFVEISCWIWKIHWNISYNICHYYLEISTIIILKHMKDWLKHEKFIETSTMKYLAWFEIVCVCCPFMNLKGNKQMSFSASHLDK